MDINNKIIIKVFSFIYIYIIFLLVHMLLIYFKIILLKNKLLSLGILKLVFLLNDICDLVFQPYLTKIHCDPKIKIPKWLLKIFLTNSNNILKLN